jgi:ABC-type uncharacterized transport system substrate-binding protein
VALLKEAVPGLKRVAFVIDPSDPNSHQVGGTRTTVEALGLSSGEVRVSGPEAVEDVFAAIAKEAAKALGLAIPQSLLVNTDETIE